VTEVQSSKETKFVSYIGTRQLYKINMNVIYMLLQVRSYCWSFSLLCLQILV